MGDTTPQASLQQTDLRAGSTPAPRSEEHGLVRSAPLRDAWAGSPAKRHASALAGNPSLQAFWLLRVVFTIAPVVAGLDKFFHQLVDWDRYLAPVVDDLIGGHGHALMLAVGMIEIVAGVGVALRPRLFAYVVSAWLLGIVGNLLLSAAYYDIALRDFGLAVAALALGRLSEVHARERSTQSSAMRAAKENR
jgi:hypothetical protein